MSKLGLIIRREYIRRVSKKSFILITLLMPFMITALVFVPLWLSSIKSGDASNVYIADETGKYAHLFEDTESYHFVHSDLSLEAYKNSDDKSIYAILSITDDLLQNPSAATIYSDKQISTDLSRHINNKLSLYLKDEKLASYNIPGLKEIISSSQINFNVQTIKWSKDGSETVSSAMISSIIAMIFTMVVYMFIMVYGAMVMQGVMEEKSNRIIELMISSVRPFDLMLGKIIGIGFVGLTQIFLWGVLSFSLITGAGLIFGMEADIASLGAQTGALSTAANIDGIAQAAQQATPEWFTALQAVNWMEIGFFFVVFFIGGYLLYASMFAAFGSAIDNQEDTQQFVMPITILMVFALYAGIYSIENPDGPLAFWCSLIPLTSPIVMMVRIPFEIPLWEKLLSVALLYATAISITWLSAKIYRVGILMYGKKPRIKEMIKWLKYK